jgi:hypothetical protein
VIELRSFVALRAHHAHSSNECRDSDRCRVALARFSHQFLGSGFEDTENLDGGPTGVLVESKKRLWTTACDHGSIFGPSAS